MSWIAHTLDRSRWRPQRQALALATLSLFVGVIIGAVYLSQSSATSALGRQLEELIVRRDDLEQQNEQLRAEIASLQSMPRLQRRAEELNFSPAGASDIEYIVVDGYNPNRGIAVVPLESSPDAVPVYDETFSGWLEQQWDDLRGQLESFTSQGGG